MHDKSNVLTSFKFQIPYVFTLNRWKLGKACYRKVPISGIGVLNHQGSDECFKKIQDFLQTLRTDYAEKLSNAMSNFIAIN